MVREDAIHLIGMVPRACWALEYRSQPKAQCRGQREVWLSSPHNVVRHLVQQQTVEQLWVGMKKGRKVVKKNPMIDRNCLLWDVMTDLRAETRVACYFQAVVDGWEGMKHQRDRQCFAVSEANFLLGKADFDNLMILEGMSAVEPRWEQGLRGMKVQATWGILSRFRSHRAVAQQTF